METADIMSLINIYLKGSKRYVLVVIALYVHLSQNYMCYCLRIMLDPEYYPVAQGIYHQHVETKCRRSPLQETNSDPGMSTIVASIRVVTHHGKLLLKALEN